MNARERAARRTPEQITAIVHACVAVDDARDALVAYAETGRYMASDWPEGLLRLRDLANSYARACRAVQRVTKANTPKGYP